MPSAPIRGGKYDAIVSGTPMNNPPVISASPTITATEQVTVTLNPALTVSDADLDALNGGAGNYAGATFGINGTPENDDDVFTFNTSGALFTVNGSNLQSGGLTFATITDGVGALNIHFDSSGTIATTALVNDVLRHLRYTNVSNAPPSSVLLGYSFVDFIPGGLSDADSITVNITGVNDVPVLDLDSTTAGQDFVASYTENAAPVLIMPNAVVSDADSANFAGGKVGVFFASNGQVGDSFSIVPTGTGPGQISTSGNDVLYEGVVIGTGTHGSGSLILNLNGNATPAAIQALLRQVAISSTRDSFSASSWNVAVEVNDGDFSQFVPGSGFAGGVINITVVDDPADALNDVNSVAENAVLNGSVIGNDTDVDGPLPVTVDQVNGSGANVGMQITLASGAKLTLNANGTYTYDPNGKFNWLTDNMSGAVNIAAPDSFTYRLTNGDTATVAITVNGVVTPDDVFFGDATNNVITGTNTPDVFLMMDGGSDTAIGNGGNDYIFYGATLDATDDVDGGAGVDTLALQGNYTLALGAQHLDGIERLVLYSGTQGGGSPVDYTFSVSDAAVAAGTTLIVQSKNLTSTEQLIFNGAAEQDGHFIMVSGAGNDFLTGGQRSDSLSGAAGNDQLFGRGGDDYLYGGLGADQLRGGMGNDRFYYDNVNQSTTGSVDSIVDFQTIDRIDLGAIDADGNAGNGDTAFTFIGNAAFGNVAGQLRATESGGIWTVEGDVNGDGVADLVISVTTVDPIPLEGADFVL